jgi:hypothetical protein
MPISSLTDPPLEEALTLLETGFKREGMLTLVGECEVEYDGRAASHLPLGERLVILKPDGTLLVHRDEQRKPVNWQPPGSTHTARLDGDRLIVESVRTSPHEELEIAFEALTQVSLLELDDSLTSHSKAVKKISASGFSLILISLNPDFKRWQPSARPLREQSTSTAKTPMARPRSSNSNVAGLVPTQSDN